MFRISLARCSALLLLLLLAAPAPPAAAADGPIAWVILDTLKPGKGGDYVRLITETYGPTLDSMMIEGKILGWGIAERANADGGYTHAGWVVYPNWTAYAAVEDSFGAAFANASAEDQARITAGFVDATEPREHLIRYLRGTVFEFAADGPKPRYLLTGDWYARPGKEAEARAVFEQARPILDGLLAESAITGFGIYEQELHDGGASHVTWFTCADLSAMDKFNAAFAAAGGDDSEFAQQIAAAFDMSAHRDSLWQIRHLGGGGGDGGGNGDSGDDGQ